MEDSATGAGKPTGKDLFKDFEHATGRLKVNKAYQKSFEARKQRELLQKGKDRESLKQKLKKGRKIKNSATGADGSRFSSQNSSSSEDEVEDEDGDLLN